MKGRDRNTDPGRTGPVSAGVVVPGSDSTIAAYAPRAPPTGGDTTVCRRIQQLASITVADRRSRVNRCLAYDHPLALPRDRSSDRRRVSAGTLTLAFRPTQQRAGAPSGAPGLLLCQEAGVSPCAPGRRPFRSSPKPQPARLLLRGKRKRDEAEISTSTCRIVEPGSTRGRPAPEGRARAAVGRRGGSRAFRRDGEAPRTGSRAGGQSLVAGVGALDVLRGLRPWLGGSPRPAPRGRARRRGRRGRRRRSRGS